MLQFQPGDNVQWTYPRGEGIDEVTGIILNEPKTVRGTIISIDPWTHVPNRTEKTIRIRHGDRDLYICDQDAAWFNLEVIRD
jgi:hypothetical protein